MLLLKNLLQNTHFKVKLSYYYKYVTEYRKLDAISYDGPNICSFLDPSIPKNPVQQLIYEFNKKIYGEALHPCPYLIVRNI